VSQDAEVRAEWVAFDNAELAISAYLARPAGEGRWPAIVMIHEGSGLRADRQQVARELAAEGYVVLTPNLYTRIGGTPPAERDLAVRHRIVGLALQDEQILTDLLAGRAYLQGRAEVLPDRTGLIGFHRGGSAGLYATCKTDVFHCFVDFYGPLDQSAEEFTIGRSLMPRVKDLTCPIQFHVGDQDEDCPPAQVEVFRQELARYGKVAECYSYPGAGHAFHRPGRTQHPAAAALAWERSLEFFHRYLSRG
jgi:carboxymethylenebutenolidase